MEDFITFFEDNTCFQYLLLCVFLLLFNVHLRRCIVMVFDCLRFDKANKKGVASGYFLWLVIGYGFGKLLCNTTMFKGIIIIIVL